MNARILGFIFGASLGCALFTGPAYQTFGDHWLMALVPLSILTGGVLSWLFGSMSGE